MIAGETKETLVRATGAKVLAAAVLLVLAQSSAGGAQPMDKVVCTVADPKHVATADFGEKLCMAVSRSLGASPISRQAMDALLADGGAGGGSGRLHVVAVKIVSAREIACSYAFGTAGEWRARSVTSFPDLAIDVMDATLGDQSIAQLADTVGRLSQ